MLSQTKEPVCQFFANQQPADRCMETLIFLLIRRSFWKPFGKDFPLSHRPHRAEHLLITIGSHTNPKRQDFFLKQPGQKSGKEERLEHRKGLKKAVNGSLKVRAYVWKALPNIRTTHIGTNADKQHFNMFIKQIKYRCFAAYP